jgi:hypothetical protein
MAFINFTVKAAIITVSNNPNVPGQYTSLQAAIDAAAPNDTLYIQGSTTSYGDINLYKLLTLIGVGAMPNKSSSLPSQIGSINIRYTDDGTSNGSGSSIYGCKLVNINLSAKVFNAVVNTINNITISRNFLMSITSNYFNSYGDYTFSGININNNNIFQIDINSLGGGSVIKNNIIGHGLDGTGSINSGNWLVLNNVINHRISYCTNGIFINNIIYGTNGIGCSGLIYCDFTKNIFYTPSTTQFDPSFFSESTLNNNNNTTSGNIINQNPDFVYYDSYGTMSYSVSNPANGPFVDYHLSNSSPGKNYGTDGTDLGIYGGTTPFVEGATTDSRFRYFPMPAMPQMLDLTITNQSIPANSTLNVNFSAEKKN